MKYFEYTKEQLIQRIKELEEANILLKELSAFDELTKISNQRTLIKYLNCKINEANKTKTPLCIAMFDIDDFKNINDTKGHVYGNTVLACLAEIIQDNIRDTDLAGRFGGDEFMVILTNTNLNVAQCIAERIRKAVAETVFTDGLRITISGGLKQYDSETYMDLIHFADINMYKAKEHGKNRIR
jgi:diguanylate cyclase (GGDEF)-like protein